MMAQPAGAVPARTVGCGVGGPVAPVAAGHFCAHLT
jgi:hypothetical protein